MVNALPVNVLDAAIAQARGWHLAPLPPQTGHSVDLAAYALRAEQSRGLPVPANATGASYISPFIGRLDDYGAEGMTLIEEIRAIYDNYGFDTEILAASIRTPAHVTAAALAGADCATIPPTTFADLFKHPLTEKGLEQFLSDWAKTGQSIL